MAEDLIVSDPQILGGKACMRGTRLSVEFLIEFAASRATGEQISSGIRSSRRTASPLRFRTPPTCSKASTPGS